MTRWRYALLAGLLGLLPMLLPLTVDGSLPLISAVPAYFQTSTASVQYSLSAAVLGIALGQLVYGPLSDRFGRKPVLIGGISLYIATAIACSMAASIGELIGLRFLQGFFACSGIIVARAVVRDLFDREDAARLFALMMGIHGIMPTIAPGYFRLDYPGIRLAGPVLGDGRIRAVYAAGGHVRAAGDQQEPDGQCGAAVDPVPQLPGDLA